MKRVRFRIVVLIYIAHACACAQGTLVQSREIATVLEWPLKSTTDQVYVVKQSESCSCLSTTEGEEEDEDGDEEVIMRGGQEIQSGNSKEPKVSPWICEQKCGILEHMGVNEAVQALKGKARKALVLWESTAFAPKGHNKQALREVMALAKASSTQVLMYTYDGWRPSEPAVVAWWEFEHRGNLRAWQSSAKSFGGWGRATLSLVEDGQIVWDVFDIVHSSKHRKLLRSFHFKEHESLLHDALRFAPSSDLAAAFKHIRSEHYDERLLPFQICLQVAKQVLSPAAFSALVSGKSEDHLDSVAAYCEEPGKEAVEMAHTHEKDVEYERFVRYARDMGLVTKTSSAWEHARTTFRSTVEFLHEQGNPTVALLSSKVPVYEEGISGGLGVGERHEALMLSLCYVNTSISDPQLTERFRPLGFHSQSKHPPVNTDQFLVVLPCKQLTSKQVCECIKAVLADLYESVLDLVFDKETSLEVGGLLFGVGFADQIEHVDLKAFWLDHEHSQEFPEDEVTEQYAHEQQARDAKESGFFYKDEL